MTTETAIQFLTAFIALQCLQLFAIYAVLKQQAKYLKEVVDNTDLIRSAAEGIERNVMVMAEPMRNKSGKRFQRWLRVKWPMIMHGVLDYFKKTRKPERFAADAPLPPGTFVAETTTTTKP